MEFLKKAILVSLRVYKKRFSPLLPAACRFHPSCSEYAHLAISKYGVCYGSLLSLKRLCKCHPFHAGGYDPVA